MTRQAESARPYITVPATPSNPPATPAVVPERGAGLRQAVPLRHATRRPWHRFQRRRPPQRRPSPLPAAGAAVQGLRLRGGKPLHRIRGKIRAVVPHDAAPLLAHYVAPNVEFESKR